VIDVALAPADAAELAEMLQFLSDWLSRDRDRLEPSLESFVGSPAYGTRQLRQDLAASSCCSAAVTASRYSTPGGSRARDPALAAAAGIAPDCGR
jgi:hypothetical protein